MGGKQGSPGVAGWGGKQGSPGVAGLGGKVPGRIAGCYHNGHMRDWVTSKCPFCLLFVGGRFWSEVIGATFLEICEIG